MKKSSNTRSVSLNRDLFVLTKKLNELGNEFLGILIWTVYVVSSRDDDRHLETVNVRPDRDGRWVCCLGREKGRKQEFRKRTSQ